MEDKKGMMKENKKYKNKGDKTCQTKGTKNNCFAVLISNPPAMLSVDLSAFCPSTSSILSISTGED